MHYNIRCRLYSGVHTWPNAGLASPTKERALVQKFIGTLADCWVVALLTFELHLFVFPTK
jgi:hypothetical protein